MSKQKYICVDLDGTIAHYKGWQGHDHFGDPIDGVQAALQRIQSAGFKIIIHTTRSNKDLISAYLNRHSIPFDYINENPDQPDGAIGGKPMAEAYIDDRAVQFNGDWQAAAHEALTLVPWGRRTPPNQ